MLLFSFQTQHFVLEPVSLMPDLIRVGEANVKHNVQIPSQIPLRQHFVALQLMVYIIQLQTHV